MSYARLSDSSDVQVYADADAGSLRCLGCMADFDSTAGIIQHLEEHIAAGETVPASLIPALEADQAKNDAWLAGAGGAE